MNGEVHRSHFSLRLGDVSPEVRRGLWKHALASLAVAGGVVMACILTVWLVTG